MKKTILVATSLLLLTACNQAKPQPVDITNQLQKVDYNDEIADSSPFTIQEPTIEKFTSKEFNLSFNYSSNWEVETSETSKNIKGIRIKSPKGNHVRPTFVYLPWKSFEEEEKNIGEESRLRLLGNFSPTDSKKYTAKQYGAEDGSYYIVKVDKIYVRVDDGSNLTQKEKEQLDIILNSLSSL